MTGSQILLDLPRTTAEKWWQALSLVCIGAEGAAAAEGVESGALVASFGRLGSLRGPGPPAAPARAARG